MKFLLIFIAALTAVIPCIEAFAATDVMVDGFEGGTWNAKWNGAWIKAVDQVHGGTASARADSANDGMFTTTGINTAGATSITVDFWFRKDNTDTGSDFFLYYFDGSNYNQIADLDAQGADDTWLHYTQTVTDSRYFKTDFQVRFEARNLSSIIASLDENVWIDDFKVTIETAGAVDNDADGYNLDVDCNDNDPSIHPGAEDICGDGIDQDCSGADTACTGTCQQWTATNDEHVAAGRAYTQSDSSACDTVVGYYAVGSNEPLGEGTGAVTTTLMTLDGGRTYRTGSCPTGADTDNDGYSPPQDCNDNDAAIHPGAPDICEDGIDQDCDGADAQCAQDCQAWTATNAEHVAAGRAYTQTDTSACEGVVTYYAVGSAENLGTGTGAQSTTLYSTDGGRTYHVGSCPTTTDADGDGYSPPADCNDNDGAIHPGATEVCEDGVDQDCDGVDAQCVTNDGDGDGYAPPDDCDDQNPAIHPGAEDICEDGIDQNCDGVDATCPEQTDYDNDGFDTTTDCDDNDRTIYPGAPEVCGDGIDQNCDGNDLSCGPDYDGDGYGNVIDCNDSDVAIHPGGVEVCGDGIDQDCSGDDLPCSPPPPSCVYNLGNWKIKYKQKYSDCKSCHTTCTPGGHSCTVGGTWGSLNCVNCHSSAHF